ncbi:MAG: hypothetical protein ACYTEP_11505 [Planctomycetota bacterium]|jgi:hypothetical protein
MVISALLLLVPICAAPAQDPVKVAEFTKALRTAEEVGDSKGMQKALRKYREDAVLSFMARAGVRAAGQGDIDNDDWVDLFIEVWNDTYHTDFARNYDRYLQRLTPTMAGLRRDLLNKDYPMVNRMHIQGLNGEETSWGILRENAIALAKAIEETGDLYYFALSSNIVGNVHHPSYHEEGSDAAIALEAYAAAADAREQLGLTNDRLYGDLKKVESELRGILGVPDPDHPEEGPVAPKANKEDIHPMEDVEPVEAVLKMEFEKKPGAIIHASDLADEDHWNWLRGNMPKPGEQITITGIDPPVRLIRVDPGKFTLEAGDAETKPFRISPKPEMQTVMRKHADGTVRPFTMELCTGTDSDVYQGSTMNLQPTDEGGPLFFRSVQTQTTKTAFGEFTLYDTNSDGLFGYEELKQIWAEGLMDQVFIYRPDAMTLGKMKYSWPFSRFIRDAKGRWFEVVLPSQDAPGSVKLTQVQPNLGRIQYSISGVKKLKPASILLASNSSRTKGLVVDLAGMKGKVQEIPIGRYQFLQARLVGKDGAEVLVQPDPSRPFFLDVSDDPEDIVTLELGGPFEFRASVSVDGAEVTVDGLSVHLVGISNERWFRVIGEPMYGIEMAIKGEKPIELRKPNNDEAATQWQRLFYPMDGVIEMKKENPKPEVILSLKKHPWFGKISNRVGD